MVAPPTFQAGGSWTAAAGSPDTRSAGSSPQAAGVTASASGYRRRRCGCRSAGECAGQHARGRSVFRRRTRRPAHRPAPRGPDSRPRRARSRDQLGFRATSRRGCPGSVRYRRPRRWPARRRCRRPAGCAPAGWRAPARPGRRSASRWQPAGLSAASVATTAMVVFSGLDSASSAAKAAICSAGGATQPELGDQVRHPRQAGSRVHDIARAVHHDDGADRHTRFQGDRRGAHAAFEHPGAGTDTRADGARRRRRRRRPRRRGSRTRRSGGRPSRRPEGRRSPRPARSGPRRRPSATPRPRSSSHRMTPSAAASP